MYQEVHFDAERHIYTTAEGVVLPGITNRMKAAGALYEFEGNDFIAMEKGNRIHAALHYDCEGDLLDESIDPEEYGYIEAARKARKEFGLEIIKAEYAVGSVAFGYATKIDLFCLWKGRKTVANWKTSEKVYRSYAVQSALEALLFSPEAVQRLGIHLRSDGSYRPIFYKDHRDFEVAKAILTINAWRSHG